MNVPTTYHVNYMPCVSLANKNTLETVQYGVEGSTTFLECQARSPHMSLKWHLLKENSDRRKEVSRDVTAVSTITFQFHFYGTDLVHFNKKN